MKKALLSLFFVLVFSLFTLPSVHASNSYCTKIENYSCVESYSSLDGFLNNISGEFYPPLGFEAGNGWIYFRDAYFDFYIPTYVIEYLISSSSSYFTMSNWIDYDENRNKIHDEIDDVIKDIVTVEKAYFGDGSKYKFKKWEGKIPFVIGDWAMVEDICGDGALGCYTSSLLSLGTGLIVPLDLILVDNSALKSVIAHEVFHAIQNVYINDDLAFWSAGGYKNDNFFEGTAVLMQKNIASWKNGYLNFLQLAPNLYPQYSIFTPTDAPGLTDYGSFIWYNFLERKFGKDFMPKLLKAYATASSSSITYRSFLAATDAIESEGSSIYDAYLEYVTWNYDYTKYSDGKYFEPTHITKSHSKFPTGTISIAAQDAPALFASNYIEFKLGSENKNLEVSFTGNLDADMYLTFLSSKKGRVDYKTVVNYPIGKGETYSFTIPSYGNDTVVMITSVLDINVQDQTDNIFYDYVYPYFYSAKRVDPLKIDEDISIGNINLKDYFIFDSGKTWKYKTVFTEGDAVKDDELSVETVECTFRDDCITYDNGGTKRSFFLFGKNVYGFRENKEEIPQVKYLTVDSFSSVLGDKQYKFFGYKKGENGLSQLSLACTPSLADDYEFNGSVYPAVINDCVLQTIDGVGSKGQFKSTEYYVKGVGLVKYSEDGYYNDKPLYSYEESLVDTNLVDMADVEEEVTEEVENPFSDLATDHKNVIAILYLKANGMIDGYSDSTFKPDNTVTRAELMKIIVAGKGQTPDVSTYSNCFKDVKDEWFAPYVCYAKEQKWTDGYTDGKFRSSQVVSKVEAIKILLSSQGITIPADISEKPFDDVEVGAWYTPFITQAKLMGILEEIGDVLNGNDGMTRAGICENLYRLLTYQ